MRGGRRPITAVLGLMLLAQQGAGQTRTAHPPDRAVLEYLDSALTIMQGHVLGADTVDWDAFRTQLHERAAGAEEPVDAYEALRWGLRALNPHSFLQISPELRAREREREAPVDDGPSAGRSEPQPLLSPFSARRNPEGRVVEVHGRKVGVVAVPTFGGGHGTAFADSIQSLVREADEAGACGWVVDLRGNGGGNMWPMLAGLSPLLREGTLGEFHDASGVVSFWFIEDGVSGIAPVRGGDTVEIGSVTRPYRLDRHPPVAVLVDRGTGSSGEAVAIAFVARPATRSFGARSYGFTTANDGFRLPDGANMVLTVGVNADRTGRPYPSGIEPYVPVPLLPDGAVPAEPPAPDAQLDAALEWLANRPACRSRVGPPAGRPPRSPPVRRPTG